MKKVHFSLSGFFQIGILAICMVFSRQAFSQTAVYQINCGGPAVAPFAADQYFSGGNSYITTNTINVAGVTNAAPMSVYQSERYGTQTSDLLTSSQIQHSFEHRIFCTSHRGSYFQYPI